MARENQIGFVKGLLIALSHLRGLWAVSGGAFILCFTFYIFFDGLAALGVFASIVLGILYYAQDVLLYHPNLPENSRTYIPTPSMHNLPNEVVNICTTDNVTLHAFWIGQPKERCKGVPTFVYFHGNAGNMGHRMQNVWGIYYNLHSNVLMVEYRGYGLSAGTPSERGLLKDSRAAVDYLFTRDDLDHSQIVIFGRSLGGAVAIDVATDPAYSTKIMCAIVENTFTNIPDMAVELMHPSMKYIPRIFYKNQFQSLAKIRKCTVPFLFISGMADNIVPPRMMRALFTHCSSRKKRILEFKGGSHNDTWMMDGYYLDIVAFLSECHHIDPPLQKPPTKCDIWSEIQNV